MRDSRLFVRLGVGDGDASALDVDFAVNWRSRAPTTSPVGAVLAEEDAIAGKLSAVYTRGEVRDFLDLDAIRCSGRYSDADLLALGRQHDDGFDRARFAESLSVVLRFLPSEAEEYEIDADAFEAVRRRTIAWAVALRDSADR